MQVESCTGRSLSALLPRPVLLFYITAMVFLVSAAAGKGNPFTSATIIEVLVNELTTII